MCHVKALICFNYIYDMIIYAIKSVVEDVLKIATLGIKARAAAGRRMLEASVRIAARAGRKSRSRSGERRRRRSKSRSRRAGRR